MAKFCYAFQRSHSRFHRTCGLGSACKRYESSINYEPRLRSLFNDLVENPMNDCILSGWSRLKSTSTCVREDALSIRSRYAEGQNACSNSDVSAQIKTDRVGVPAENVPR